jgi:bifunctional UDP-N-acetylglucosamine pyrophosphorylase/glucosamine-1-phosphate N-acetyltransferase
MGVDAYMREYEKEAEARLQTNLRFAAAGVRFADIRTAYIDENTAIGSGTFLGPCVVIEGAVEIGRNCRIGQNTRIQDSRIGDDTEIEQSVILRSRVGNHVRIGPFAYLRPGSDIGDHAKIGDFVEVKNASVGDGSKASHLTYIGDADVGANVNLGCGVVFVNYDGKNKYRSTVKDGAFVGCNVNIVSPAVIGESAYVAAGTTVTRDVPQGSLSVGRTKEKLIEGWVERKGLLRKRT